MHELNSHFYIIQIHYLLVVDTSYRLLVTYCGYVNDQLKDIRYLILISHTRKHKEK
jgi:hypothetical protein